MENKKQSSVEWYIENRKKLEYDYDTKGIGILNFIERKNEIEKQAKAMHKEEVESAWRNGLIKGMDSPLPEKYYNESSHYYYKETFKGNNE